ncbi:MaoC/PaaZ C-terminal domain-containing protein [Sphingomonas sp. ID0503]|uniref:MaoC/PaaZ C-terminal domain-containing protein n=1 Tax=Sphingomonas sp. ID0503 TaxID=3399691 RepID=UPI003AFB53EB
MALNAEALLAHSFAPTRHAYTERDAILYALGLGLGADPCDAADLAFLDERQLRVLPSYAVTLASPGMWIRDERFGVDFKRLVHSEQFARFHAPLPPKGEIIGTGGVESLTDRGEGRGAVLTVARQIADAQSGALHCELRQTLLLRGDGGFGGPAPARQDDPVPARVPDYQCSVPTSRRAALIYRLSGDWNPLHLDPAFARTAGFDRPILQGLASYGMAGIAVARATGADPSSITTLGCRFAGVVMPGDTLAFSIWRTDDGFAFAANVGDRIVLDRGVMTIG